MHALVTSHCLNFWSLIHDFLRRAAFVSFLSRFYLFGLEFVCISQASRTIYNFLGAFYIRHTYLRHHILEGPSVRVCAGFSRLYAVNEEPVSSGPSSPEWARRIASDPSPKWRSSTQTHFTSHIPGAVLLFHRTSHHPSSPAACYPRRAVTPRIVRADHCVEFASVKSNTCK